MDYAEGAGEGWQVGAGVGLPRWAEAVQGAVCHYYGCWPFPPPQVHPRHDPVSILFYAGGSLKQELILWLERGTSKTEVWRDGISTVSWPAELPISSLNLSYLSRAVISQAASDSTASKSFVIKRGNQRTDGVDQDQGVCLPDGDFS